MRPIITFLAALLAVFTLTLAGCSTQPGGSTDPENFKAELTPPAAEAQPTPAAPAPEGSAPGLAELEARLEGALSRISTLEQSMDSLQQTIATIEQTAREAMAKAEADPLAGVDIKNDDEVGRALMQQSLEQIIGISRLLLDKMEGKLEDLQQEAGEPQAAPAQ